MNIHAINYIPNSVYLNIPRQKNLQGKTLPFAIDTVEISFRGIEENQDLKKTQRPTNLENALHISGIHCPVCGKKMLAKEDFENYIAEFQSIKYGREFIKKLQKDNEFIPDRYKQIIKDGNKIMMGNNMTLSELYKNLKAKASKDKANAIMDAKFSIKEILKDNPNKEKVQLYLNIMDQRTSYEDYKEYLNKIIKQAGLDKDTANEIRNATYDKVKSTSRYYDLFKEVENNSVSGDSLSIALARKIFEKSTSNITTIQNFPEHIHDPQNTTLECDECLGRRQENYFWKWNVNLDNFNYGSRRYLGDIARLIGQGRVDAQYNYLDYYVFVMRLLTKNKVDITPQELKHLSSLINCSKRQDEAFMPIEQSTIDIPCAKCGSVLLTHDKHMQIVKELKTCSSPQEYANVILKNKRYVGKYGKPITKMFVKIVRNNPEITNEEFIPILKKGVRNHVEQLLNDALIKYQKKIINCTDQRDIDISDEIFYKTNKYIKDGKFEDYEISKMIVECVGNTAEIKLRSAYELAADIKEALYIGSLCNTDIKDAENDKDPVYTVLYKIYTSSGATADHLVARARGGEDNKDNIIGLCKACNKIKSSASASTWYFNNPSVDQNLTKQLKIIDWMAKTGRITGYDNWAHNIAEIMYEATHGIYDVRELYPYVEENNDEEI